TLPLRLADRATRHPAGHDCPLSQDLAASEGLSAMSQQFASDNNAGICPAAFAALEEANSAGHTLGYGSDRWTAALSERMCELFETDCLTYLVFNGTAANALSLAALCRPHHAVICHALSHIDTDEAGAPERFTGGAKLLAAETPNAKLTPDAV